MSFQIDDGYTDLVLDTAWGAIVRTCIVLQDDWASDDVERTRIKFVSSFADVNACLTLAARLQTLQARLWCPCWLGPNSPSVIKVKC